MDLYRYFYPHHNPRLRKVAVRNVELGELEQAATELRNAIERAKVRTETSTVGAIREQHFGDILTALEYVVDSLKTLEQAHPGDETSVLEQLASERKHAAGWENWAQLLSERLNLMHNGNDNNGLTSPSSNEAPADSPPSE